MFDEQLIASTHEAPWLPSRSTAEAWAGRSCEVPEPSIIVRLLMTREASGRAEFFTVPTYRGPDLPTLALTSGTERLSTADGLIALASTTHGNPDLAHRCVGFIRNVVPEPDPAYPHPTPWAHVPVIGFDACSVSAAWSRLQEESAAPERT
jgi:hypothetical protein